ENIVVFNLPLLFQLENKYQVASVLCHEIAHQKLNHVQNSIIQHAKINNSKEVKDKTKEIAKQKYNRNQFASQLLKKLIYNNKELSRKLELEADSLGFVYFNKAFKNNIQAPLETLTLLKSLDKEKDSLTIEDYKEILKNTGLTFNKEWFTSELSGYNYQKGNKFWNIDS
ncbi:M48 family metalloprotease, partial [Microcystis aeruginosa]|uniref:M48 family metalloprotease n=1 Tax=Microcystis aeruginosa TaxID=1126 RepID=UPI0011152BA9